METQKFDSDNSDRMQNNDEVLYMNKNMSNNL